MKILIVGSDKIYAIENFYVRYLKSAGAEVFVFTAQNIFFKYYERNLINKIFFKLGLSRVYSLINKKFILTVDQFLPNVVWVFKGMEIFPETLQEIKARNIKLVNYNPDNPFIFSGKGSGNRNITDSISLYDLHFTYNLSVKKKLEASFKTRVAILPFGFDLSAAWYDECVKEQEILKVCFLGNPDRERADFILALAKEGFELDVFGHDWKQFVNHHGIEVHDALYGDEVWKMLRKYRVQLNLMRKHNMDSHNMRTFEVPGVGGILLAPDTEEHRMFFEPGKEIFLFKDLQQCVANISLLLGLSKGEAIIIRNAARARSLSSGYSYKDRAQMALENIQLLGHE